MANSMKLPQIMRKVHFWVSLIVIIPLFIVTTTGLVLMLKKQLDWVQPPTQKGSGKTPNIAFEEVLTSVQSVDGCETYGWSDIKRIDVRPSKGMMKVQLPDGVELQIDSESGDVLQRAVRRSDLIEDLHTGAYFGNTTKYLFFFVAEILFFIQLITGIYLFVRMLLLKQKKRHKTVVETSAKRVVKDPPPVL